ncbi:hypothetical protein GCM10023201_15270 [Actinomycetospora corticicola]|uniref:Cytochrome c5 n=1 Tax=Actinomycetospora corticicola TaxID=663602 RepID=A0A7Y9J5H3_9PSEU|nr:hypothetical protein [Actinomycetospora corticicola]NYD36115.1 cytochrome c5 [Actinomycetospora corticicola]
MSSDVDAFRGTPIFDEVDRWARRPEEGAPTMLTFTGTPTAPPSGARTVLALLAAAREERAPRHALRRA